MTTDRNNGIIRINNSSTIKYTTKGKGIKMFDPYRHNKRRFTRQQGHILDLKLNLIWIVGLIASLFISRFLVIAIGIVLVILSVRRYINSESHSFDNYDTEHRYYDDDDDEY